MEWWNCDFYLRTISYDWLCLLRSGLGTKPKPSSSINVSATDMVQHENLPPFSPNDSIYLHEQFNREHLHPHAVSNFPTFNEKPFIHFSFFPRRILTTDRATRLRGRNTCSKLAPTSRRRKKKAEVASKRIERSFSKKGFLFWKREEGEEKKFSLHGKGICTRRRIREFIPEPIWISLFFFSAILNHLLTLEREILEKGEVSSRARENEEKEGDKRVVAKVSSIPQKEKNSWKGERERRRESRAKPITRNQGIITVASERHKSDTNRVSRFNASSPLWRVIHPSLPPSLHEEERQKERERKRDEEKKEKKNGEKSYPLRRILFLGVGGSRLISLNSRETFRGTGGTLRWK